MPRTDCPNDVPAGPVSFAAEGARLRKECFGGIPSRIDFALASIRFHAGEWLRKRWIRLQTSLWRRRESVLSRLRHRPARPCPFRFEKRLPVPDAFDTQYYKSLFSAWRSDISPLEHYLEKGWKQGRNPHPLFDVKWYLEQNPGLQGAGREPFTHFLETGWREGRNPNPYFDIDDYLGRHPELARRRENPFFHYLNQGWREGSDPGPRFSIARYRAFCSDADLNSEPLSDFFKNWDWTDFESTTEYSGWPLERIPSGRLPVDFSQVGRVAVQLHAFYVDRLDEMLGYIGHLPYPFDLLVSTSDAENAREIERSVKRAGLDCALDIRCVENRGRDVAPLLGVFGKKLLSYRYALHLHSKKSAHFATTDRNPGLLWLAHNLKTLVGSPEYASEALALLTQPDCGVLMPTPWKGVRLGINWGKNREIAGRLMERIGLSPKILETRPILFPAGTMFWFRPAALEPLLAAGITPDDFPEEPLPSDGTLAHAIERCIPFIALARGYESRVIAPNYSLTAPCIAPKNGHARTV